MNMSVRACHCMHVLMCSQCIILCVCGEYEWVHLSVLHGWVCLYEVCMIECMSKCYFMHVIMCMHMCMYVSKCMLLQRCVIVHEHI